MNIEKVKGYKAVGDKIGASKGISSQNNQTTFGQKGTKSVFLSKLSKKSEKAPLNLKTHSNKSRNIGGLKDIGANVYNNQPCRTRNDVIGYELASNNSYSMAGRTMIHQMNTPTKYAVIHGNGAGLFASYNRSIPKEKSNQNNKIRITDLSYKNGTYQEGYSNKAAARDYKHPNATQNVSKKKDMANFRVRSASNNKKYRYNKDGTSCSPNGSDHKKVAIV